MKFLCIECDEVMAAAERQLPGDGTLAAVFVCGKCEREMAMLTNPMETQFVSSMGIKIGGRAEAPASGGPAPVEWSADAVDRLQTVPRSVRKMVKRIYTDWAREDEIRTIIPEVIDRARSDLGLEHM